MKYNGVEDTGIENNLAYISSELSFLTLDFALFDMMAISLCHDDMEASQYNYNDCPGDGEYKFSVPYRLPTTGKNTATWLATGWEGSGYIRMYAEENENMLIGECLLTMETMRTPDQTSDSFLRTPSAAATAGIVLGVGAVMGLMCMYCYCCMRRNKGQVKAQKKSKSAVTPEDSLEAVFKRMEDEKDKAAGFETAGAAKGWANTSSRRSSDRTYATAPAKGSLPLM